MNEEPLYKKGSKKSSTLSHGRYEKLKKIGEGTYGSVTKVIDHKMGEVRALKKIKFLANDEGIPINAMRQIAILRQAQHPNIVRLYDVHYHYEQHKLYLNLQYCEYNLYEYIRQNQPLSPYAIKGFMYQILSGLEYLHQKGIMHRDLKTQNILISREGQIKLCDFGQAKLVNLLSKKHTPEVGTLWYRAPQILLGCEEYSFKLDLWAVGCIMTEMITENPIFKSNYEVGQIFQILTARGGISSKKFPNWKLLSSEYPKIPHKTLVIPGADADALDLLEKLLQVDPEVRIGAKDALKHKYFDGYS